LFPKSIKTHIVVFGGSSHNHSVVDTGAAKSRRAGHAKRSVKEMKKKIAIFFRGFGSVLSAYLVLVYGTAILAAVLNLPYPVSPVIDFTIFIGGPLFILFIAPALILSLKWNAPRGMRAAVATLNGLGLLCSLASMFMLWAWRQL
jgi:hypothetical protein